jgi:hypothetical protein
MPLERKDTIIQICKKLLEMNIGDKPRITVIKERTEEGKILHQLDKKYLEKMAAYIKFEAPEPAKTPPQKQTPSDKPHQSEQPPNPHRKFNFCGMCGQKMTGDWNFCTSCGTKKPRKNEIKLKTMECDICHFSSTDKEKFDKHFDRAFHISCRASLDVSPGPPPTEAALNRLQVQKKEYQIVKSKQAKKIPGWIIVIGVILGIGATLTVAFPNGVTWILWVPILIGYGGWKLRLSKLLIIFLICLCFVILGLIAMFGLFMEFAGDEIIDDWTEREKILQGLNEHERLAMSTGITNCQYNAAYYVSDEYGDQIKEDCMEKLARAAENMRGP